MKRPTRPEYGPKEKTKKRGKFISALMWTIGRFALVLAVLYFLGFLAIPWGALTAPKAAAPQNAREQAKSTNKTVEVTTAESILQQRTMLATQTRREMLFLCGEASRVLKEWEEELKGWETEGPPLLRNENGKRIAVDPEQVKRFRGILRSARPNRMELETDRAKVETIAASVRESLATSSDASIPLPPLTEAVPDAFAVATKARDAYREARSVVRALVSAASDKVPRAETLEDAIAALDAREASERAALIDAAKKKAEDEAAERIAAEKVKLVKEEANAEIARIANLAALKKQEVELEKVRTAHELELKQKEADNQRVVREAEAEKKRQGDLKAGSIWVGKMDGGLGSANMTLTVGGRKKDEIQASVKIRGMGYSDDYVVSGKLTSNRLKLSRGQGGASLDGIYDAAAKTITGMHLDIFGVQNGSFRVQLSDGKEE